MDDSCTFVLFDADAPPIALLTCRCSTRRRAITSVQVNWTNHCRSSPSKVRTSSAGNRATHQSINFVTANAYVAEHAVIHAREFRGIAAGAKLCLDRRSGFRECSE